MTVDLAREAQAVFMRERSQTKIDPFSLKASGDDLRTLSRTIEWNLFREHQPLLKSWAGAWGLSGNAL
ncbi:hypothetical protein [Gluconobacter cerinus]|uniref:hypothetical protein n=1 Tax=Gluconobacter cerinus TaxID=38307 RepID=UPI001B8B2E24|nr:hypothetical protein [Gluconobacter cerinus]MBS1069747.1 hypothetical protein [Gluconobacter cerinus]